jgi:hypothetical protein
MRGGGWTGFPYRKENNRKRRAFLPLERNRIKETDGITLFAGATRVSGNDRNPFFKNCTLIRKSFSEERETERG